jgi:hypothetical protein
LTAARKPPSRDGAGNGEGAAPSAADLQKIRDILFGERARDIDDALARIEEAAAQRFAELQSRIERCRADLEAKTEALARKLGESIEQLRAGGVERDRFADLLRELASRIDGDRAAGRGNG